jgi:hypothetical protein
MTACSVQRTTVLFRRSSIGAMLLCLGCGGAKNTSKADPFPDAYLPGARTATPSASASASAAPKEEAPEPVRQANKGKKRTFRSRPLKPIGSFPARASIGDATSIDFDAIPLATSVDVGTDAAKFVLKRLDLTAHCPPRSYAPSRITYSLGLFALSSFSMRIGSVTLPARKFLDGFHEIPSLNQLPTSGLLPSTWVAIKRRPLEDGIDVTQLDGFYQAETSNGAARSKAEVRAPAILDERVYAYRKCVSGCDAVGERTEELTLIGPPAVWAGSSEESIDHAFDVRTPFTRISVPLHRGSAATLEMVAFDDDVDRFKKSLPPLVHEEVGHTNRWTTFSLEIVWSQESASPNLNLFVSHASGEVAWLRPDIDAVFTEPSVSPMSTCYRESMVEY